MRALQRRFSRLIADKSRFAALALGVSFTALLGAFGALGYGYVSNGNTIKRVQQSRYEATLRSCESRTEDRLNIARRVQPRPPYTVDDLKRDFRPVAKDCERYAREQTETD